mgnify:CR=1 FL=1
MSLVFEAIQTEGLAEISYLIGDDEEGIAAVFDPRADVEVYLELARAKTSRSLIFSRPIFTPISLVARVSFAADLNRQRSTSATREVRVTDSKTKKCADGDKFTLGAVIITARHTPGHTPEHISYLLADTEHPEIPWGVLSGDSLFVNSAGRPDLLGEKETGKLAAQQFHTLTDFYMKLPDSVIIYPAHGSGSPCGAEIGDRLNSTIGYERPLNPFLQFKDVESFTRFRRLHRAADSEILSADEKGECGRPRSARRFTASCRSAAEGI